MVRIDRVHTGSGDGGKSSLVDGSRRLKSDLRFSVVGDCDELNSIIGLARMECLRLPMHHQDGGERKGAGRVHFICDSALSRIQHELFDLGAELACPPENLPEYMVLIDDAQAETLGYRYGCLVNPSRTPHLVHTSGRRPSSSRAPSRKNRNPPP